MCCVFLTSSKVILSRVQHHCFLHTLNLRKGSPRLYSLLTLLTALRRRNRLLRSFCLSQTSNHTAMLFSGNFSLRNINTTFSTGRKECSSPPKGDLLLSHPPRQAEKQKTTRAWSAHPQPREKSQQGACLSMGTVQVVPPV